MEGNINISKIIDLLLLNNKKFCLPFRPDHGLLLCNEIFEEDIKPGYSLIGRLKGLSELLGIIYAKKTVIEPSSPYDDKLLRKKINNKK